MNASMFSAALNIQFILMNMAEPIMATMAQ